MSAPVTDRELLSGDLARGGYLRGTFAHEGAESPRWFETELVLARPGVLRRCAELLAASVPAEADRLAARGPAAVALATALALGTDLTLLFDPGTGTPDAGELFPDARVVLVEDVLMTGAHALASIAALREAGLDVVRVLAVVDREHGGRFRVEQNGVPVTALFTESELAT